MIMPTYEIKRREGRFGPLMTFDVFVDGEDVGELTPLFRTMNSNRPYGYHTHVMLEHDALTDETGFPNEYKTQRDAFAAVAELMERNGIEKSA
jgi:hypothetical protein